MARFAGVPVEQPEASAPAKAPRFGGVPVDDMPVTDLPGVSVRPQFEDQEFTFPDTPGDGAGLLEYARTFRPSLRDMDDQKLASVIRREIYPDMDAAQFYRETGFDKQFGYDTSTPDPTEGMGGGERFLAGMGKAFTDTARGTRQLGTEVVRELAGDRTGLTDGSNAATQWADKSLAGQQATIDESRRLDAPLMDTRGGFLGNVAGYIAPVAAGGAVARGTMAGRALLPRTLAGNVAAGGAGGAVQPVATGESRGRNVAIGATLGGAGYAVPVAAGGTIRTIGRVVEPFTEGGQNRIVARAIQRSASNPSALDLPNPSKIPGVQRTLAEEVPDAGIAQLQRQFPQQLADQAIDNNFARAEAIRKTFRGADEESALAIEEARDEAAGRVLSGLDDVKNPVRVPEVKTTILDARGKPFETPPAIPLPDVLSLDSVSARLGGMIEKQQGREAVQKTLAYVQSLMADGVKDANHAYNIRKTIGDLMEGKIAGDLASSSTARKELMEVRDLLDGEMSGAFPRWGDYLKTYRAESTKATQARAGAKLLERSGEVPEARLGERVMTPAKLSRMTNSPDVLARQASGFKRARAADTFTPEQSGLLADLGNDMAAVNSANTLGRGLGSPTAQNLATQNALGGIAGNGTLGRFLSGNETAQRLITPIEKTYGLFGIPDRLQTTMAEALANPQRARDIISRLPAADRILIEQHLARASGAVLRGATPALTE